MDWESFSYEKRRQAFIAGLVFIGITLVCVIGYTTGQAQFLSHYPAPSTSTENTNTSTSSRSTGKSQLDQDQEELAERNRQAQQQSSSSSSSSVQSQRSEFTISRVKLLGTEHTCSASGVAMYVSSAQVTAKSDSGGSFIWQLEVNNAYDPPVPTPKSATIAQGQITYQLSSSVSPGYLYSTTNARDGQSVRIHITAPNDVVSPWFKIPTGTESSCTSS